MKLLDGQTAIITGAASARGLGKAMAKLFAEHGARIVILDLDAAQAEDAAAEIGHGHIGLACDVTRKQDCDDAVATVLKALGQIDILVNNAGITQPLKIMDISHENYDAVMDVNLLGTLNMSQSVIPHMRERKTGKLINMSSVSAQRGGGDFRWTALFGRQGRHSGADQSDGAGTRA